jgi:hypothetical protein
MNQNDKDILRVEMETKVADAIKLLEEAKNILGQMGYHDPQKYDKWYKLKDIVEEFIDFDPSNAWTCSSW